MKRIVLSLAILLAAQIGFAQEEVAIEQNINQRINELEIYSGWNVHLIHHEADSGYRVAIITEDDLAARAYNVQLCNVKDSTLTILENTQLPRGTVVEIEGPMTFGQINLLDRATAEADYVVASAASVPEDWTNLNLCMYSSFHVRHYHIPNPENSPGIKIWDHAQLTIDTISGEGDAVVNVYADANFQYGSDILRGKITLYDYEATNNGPYQQTDVRVIKTKEVDGEITYTEHRKIWNNSISFGASIGYRSDPNPIDFESPFRHTDTRNFSWELQTGFRFSRHLGLNTGLKAMLNYQYLDHQVKLTDDGGLECIDGQTPIQKNMLMSMYFGVPVEFHYYLGKTHSNSFSMDAFLGRRMMGLLNTRDQSSNWEGWVGTEAPQLFNPWKLEMGVSFNTNLIGIFHGIRVFTNLLPEYKPGITTDKFRSIGVEIKL